MSSGGSQPPLTTLIFDVHFMSGKTNAHPIYHTKFKVEHTRNGQTPNDNNAWSYICAHTCADRKTNVIVFRRASHTIWKVFSLFLLLHCSALVWCSINSHEARLSAEKKTSYQNQNAPNSMPHVHRYYYRICDALSSWLPFLMNLNRAILFYMRYFFVHVTNANSMLFFFAPSFWCVFFLLLSVHIDGPILLCVEVTQFACCHCEMG